MWRGRCLELRRATLESRQIVVVVEKGARIEGKRFCCFQPVADFICQELLALVVPISHQDYRGRESLGRLKAVDLDCDPLIDPGGGSNGTRDGSPEATVFVDAP